MLDTTEPVHELSGSRVPSENGPERKNAQDEEHNSIRLLEPSLLWESRHLEPGDPRKNKVDIVGSGIA